MLNMAIHSEYGGTTLYNAMFLNSYVHRFPYQELWCQLTGVLHHDTGSDNTAYAGLTSAEASLRVIGDKTRNLVDCRPRRAVVLIGRDRIKDTETGIHIESSNNK